MPAPHVETPWSTACPAAYKDRIRYDLTSGLPTSFDTAAGPYAVPGPMTNADLLAVGLPPLVPRPRHRC